MGSLKLKISVTVAFLVGFIMGYKAKEWRIKWIKRKRDRLADKLVEAQAQLDLLSKNI